MILQAIESAVIKVLESGTAFGRSGGKETPHSGLLMGLASHPYDQKRWEKVFLPHRDLLKHLYILGATGSGKTKLIEFLIRQHVLGRKGFGLLDPHGDLSSNILKYIASLLENSDPLSLLEYLSKKLVLIEPFNQQGAVGFNPLETGKITSFSLAGELMGIFKKVWQDAHWGPRMEELLRNSFITLSENGLTLLEATRLLTDQFFREKLIKKVPSGTVREYWLSRYNPLSESMKSVFREPVLNRISVFTTDPGIRLMIGQSRSTIDFRKIMDQGNWLIINLARGHLRENINLLGGLLIGKLKMAAMTRVDMPEEDRLPFGLFIDEFQNFIGEDFETILSESRKYGLGLTLAHQNLDQVDRRLRASILGNVATQIFFRLSHHDASQVSSEMDQREKPLIEKRLIDFKVGQAYLKRKGEKARMLRTIHVPEPKASEEIVQIIRDLSLTNFARAKSEVEEEIERRQSMFSSIGGPAKNGLARGSNLRPRSARTGPAEGWNDW